MDIRLCGLIPIFREAGQILDWTEEFTLFGDMCLMAPVALIDKRIRREDIDNSTTKPTTIVDSVLRGFTEARLIVVVLPMLQDGLHVR